MQYGLDPSQLLHFVIRPILGRATLWSPSAEVLVLGTGMVESGLRYIDQLDKANKPGPAYGIYQCEQLTHEDHWLNFLPAHRDLRKIARRLAGPFKGHAPPAESLVFSVAYATLICRIHYLRAPGKLPEINDAAALAAYHKRHYNSYLGDTDVDKSIVHFRLAAEVSST